MTGSELKQIREDIGQAIGRSLSAADMAKLCGLAPGDGPDTIRKWEVKGPSGPAAELLRILAMASERYPILENFNVFDRFNIDEKDRPARREAFRENMRDDQKLYYAGRPASASPAGGYKARHDERQKALVEQAFGKFK